VTSKSLKPHWIASCASLMVGLVSVAGALSILLPRAYETDRMDGIGYTTGTEAAFLYGGALLVLIGAVYCLVNLIRWSSE
jgi:hypothetical protein